jgi:hypothetical protein
VDPVAAARAQVLTQQLSAVKTSSVNVGPKACRRLNAPPGSTLLLDGRAALLGSSVPRSGATPDTVILPSDWAPLGGNTGGIFTGNASCGSQPISKHVPHVMSLRGATSWGRHPATSYGQTTAQRNYTGTTQQPTSGSARKRVLGVDEPLGTLDPTCPAFIPLMNSVAVAFTPGASSTTLGQGGFRF